MDTLAKIRARRAEIDRQIEALSAEVADLHVAERVVARFEAVSGPSQSAEGAKASSQPRHVDLIVATLKASPASWFVDWAALQRAIKELHDVDIPKSSLQPYLSNLKSAGIVVRNGPNIALRERVEKGAGPQSDGSYDPESAVAPDDDEKPPQERVLSVARQAPESRFRIRLGN